MRFGVIACLSLLAGCQDFPAAADGAVEQGEAAVDAAAEPDAVLDPDAAEDASPDPDATPDGARQPDATPDGSVEVDATPDASPEPDATPDASPEPDATPDGSVEPDARADLAVDAALPVLGEDTCNDLDDDGDGLIDEIERPVPQSLTLRFTADSAVFAQDPVVILDGEGNEVARLVGALEAQVVEVQGNRFTLRLEADEDDMTRYGVTIASVEDHLGNRLPGPFPESPHPYAPGLFESPPWIGLDNLGTGGACSRTLGRCVEGVRTCVLGAVDCVGGVLPAPAETCNGVDDDCDGATDEAVAAPPDCANQMGACAGTKKHCVEGEWADCDVEDYAFYQAETDVSACSCTDLDCDGVVDGTPEALLNCTIDDLAGAQGEPGTCVVRGSSVAEEEAYYFDDLVIRAEVTASGLCGFAGGGECGGEGGGCLTLEARSLLIAGELSADGQPGANCGGGGSGGTIRLFADTLRVDGLVHADGGEGAAGPAGSGGGAAGEIVIKSPDALIAGEVRVRGGSGQAAGGGAAQGGGDVVQRPGGGGSGGPGTAEDAGPESERFLAIWGTLEFLEQGQMRTLDGEGHPAGTAETQGAIMATRMRIQAGGYRNNPVVVRVQRAGPAAAPGRGVPEVRVILIDGGSGLTGPYGWAALDAGLNEGIEYVAELIPPQEGMLELVISRHGLSECTTTVPFIAGQATLPLFEDCEQP